MSFAFRSEFRLEVCLRALQHSQGPPAIIDFFRTQFVGGLLLIAVLGGGSVQRQGGGFAASLLRGRLVPFIGQKVLERGEQEGAEAALVWMHTSEVVTGQQPGEKTLREVLRIVRAVAAPAHVDV